MEGISMADPVASIVSVEVAEFAPGVTGVGDIAQPGIGAGPATAQDS
jgi:hypothetical protein